jgi:hypothetical protein
MVPAAMLMLMVGRSLAVAAPPPVFSMQTHSNECVIGCPLMVRLTLKNESAAAIDVAGQPGWGRYLAIFRADEETDGFRELAPDAPLIDDELGGEFEPIYFFSGTLGPSQEQVMVLLLNTSKFSPGSVRLKAVLRQRSGLYETAEAKVLMRRQEDVDDGGLRRTDAAAISLYRDVVRVHNHFGQVPSVTAVTREQVRRYTATDVRSSVAAWALYVGVLSGTRAQAGEQEREQSVQAGEAFLARFPESWLRAFVCAALFEIELFRERDMFAVRYATTGLQYPEARPLYRHLGIEQRMQVLDREAPDPP